MSKIRCALGRVALSVALLLSAFLAVLALASSETLADALVRIEWPVVASMVVCLTIGALLASLRLKLIVNDFGYPLSVREAVITLSIGQLAGNLFFQAAGQMIGRAAILAQHGIPASASVIISGYERVFGLAVSVLLAACGAVYLFGRIAFDLETGGLALVKLALGFLAVAIMGATVAWGRHARAVLRQLTAKTLLTIIRNGIISLSIQLATLAAYLVAGHALAPNIGFAPLAAASLVVMFAASLPISLGGWGIREMSAVVALQAIGLSSASALLLALLIGVLSVVVVAAAAAVLLLPRSMPASSTETAIAPAFDYTVVLDWLIPIAAATAVYFQIFVPVGRGNLNINLADPLALIGGALFALHRFRCGWPAWRVEGLNLYFVATTVLIALAYLHGLYRFGWTEWAFTNRLLGWPMLLCYAATGALIVNRAWQEGLQTLLATFAATGAAIVALEFGIVSLNRLGLAALTGIVDHRLSGFSQNPNAFAFVLLLALASALGLQGRLPARTALVTLILAGLWYCGSRAGLLAAPAVIALGLISGVKPRPLFAALGCSALLVIGLALGQALSFGFRIEAAANAPAAPLGLGAAATNIAWNAAAALSIGESHSNYEHLLTVREGFAMFLSHPLFGSGLGAYMAERLRSTGTPLLIHSTPVWLLAETGLAGFAVFALGAWRIIATEFVRRRQLASLIIVLTLGAFALTALVHELLYQRALWLLLGAALAMPSNEAVRSERR